jgi:GntR family histidine utilization transcriptional repressor
LASGPPVARYQQVKNHILERVESGEWAAGHRVPSEHELVRDFGISRMTANRALRELAAEGYLNRVLGVGTFVADAEVHSEVMQIRNIADEIAERGRRHSLKLLKLGRVKATAALGRLFSMAPGATLFRSLVVHNENDIPIQLEDRYVNPAMAPDYLNVDFSKTTSNAYLMQVAPVSKVRHTVEALSPDRDICEQLRIGEGEPCLRLVRLVWSAGVPASCAWLTHPGSRFRMTAEFHPSRILPFERALSERAGGSR